MFRKGYNRARAAIDVAKPGQPKLLLELGNAIGMEYRSDPDRIVAAAWLSAMFQTAIDKKLNVGFTYSIQRKTWLCRFVDASRTSYIGQAEDEVTAAALALLLALGHNPCQYYPCEPGSATVAEAAADE